MPLKDINCRNAKPQDKTYRLYDEQGLYLEVQPNGGRYWRLKYRFLGKEKRLAFGVYPEVGLLDARKKRDEARAQLAAGHDPSLQKRMAKAVSQFDHQHTFESVALHWLAVRESSWDPEYTRTVKQRLELNAYPWLGKLPISSISTPLLVENLQRIVKRGAAETAQVMLKTLIATLTNNLSRPKYNPEYQTRVDPELGDMTEIHDTMEFESSARAAEMQHIDDTWLSHRQTHGTCSSPGNWCNGVFEHAPSIELFSDPFMDINPANGLPMMDECLDVAGNLFGTSGFDTDVHSSFF